MKQRSLAETRCERRSNLTKRQRFLNETDVAMPWPELVTTGSPAELKRCPRGRRIPLPAETIRRIDFIRQGFALSDPAMEKALHDITAMRAFAKRYARKGEFPGESAVPRLRLSNRLEKNQLAGPLLAIVNALLEDKGLLLRQGAIVAGHPDRGPEFHEEPDRHPRPRHASDEDWQPVVVLHQGARRCGCQIGSHRYFRGDGRQRQRRDPCPRAPEW